MSESYRSYRFRAHTEADASAAQDPGYRLSLETTSDALDALPPRAVAVRVKATSLNYRDLIHWRKKAGRNVEGIVPLSDGAGEVIAVGKDVTRVQPGDRVAATFFTTWLNGRFSLSAHRHDLGGSVDGMLREIAVLDEDALVRIPAYLSYDEAACLPCAGLTAWYALVKRGGFQAGDSLLVLGTGGVSVFALQFGLAMGGTVYVTSGSDEKLARAQTLGAAHTVNYRTHTAWHKEIWRLSEQRGVDHVIEVGGPGTLEQSMSAVAPGGHIALIGVLTGFGPPSTSLFPLLARNVTLNGIYVGSREDFEAMNQFLDQHQLHPVIDRSFPFAEAEDAFRYLESGSHFGKVVVTHE